MTIVMASHKMEEIIRFTDRVMVLHEGEIVAFDTPQKVFQNEALFEKVQVDIPSPIELSTYLQKREIPVNTFSTIEEGEKEIRYRLEQKEAVYES
jgi:ABC-type multidrug transport system ATPase subunit